jgi:hypothetical protein
VEEMGKKTAAVLSLLITGLGQFYAGHFWRAVAWFFGGIFIVAALTFLTGIGGIIAWAVIWIACTWDAYNIAR